MTPQYRKLIRQFPLVPIRDDIHFQEATRIVEVLIDEWLDMGGEAYLEVLSMLVCNYEEMFEETVDPVQVLRELLNQHGMTQKHLAGKIGCSPVTVCYILKGKRKLSVKMIKKLAELFKVKPEVFL